MATAQASRRNSRTRQIEWVLRFLFGFAPSVDRANYTELAPASAERGNEL